MLISRFYPERLMWCRSDVWGLDALSSVSYLEIVAQKLGWETVVLELQRYPAWLTVLIWLAGCQTSNGQGWGSFMSLLPQCPAQGLTPSATSEKQGLEHGRIRGTVWVDFPYQVKKKLHSGFPGCLVAKDPALSLLLGYGFDCWPRKEKDYIIYNV